MHDSDSSSEEDDDQLAVTTNDVYHLPDSKLPPSDGCTNAVMPRLGDGATPAPPTAPKSQDHKDSDDDDEDSIPIRAPRGRMAARLQKNQLPDDEDEPTCSPETPVKKPRRLQRAIPSSPRSQSSVRSATSSPPMIDGGSDTEAEELPALNRLAELVAKKKADRQARDAAEATKRQVALERDAAIEAKLASSPPPGFNPESSKKSKRLMLKEDLQLEHKLTQNTKPKRKAGKKALEEMRRETQRLDRGRQLVHEPTTRTKFTKESFLQRMNYFKSGVSPLVEEQSAPLIPEELIAASSSTASSRPRTPIFDAIAAILSPGTSPPSEHVDPVLKDDQSFHYDVSMEEEELPSLDAIMTQREPRSSPQESNIPSTAMDAPRPLKPGELRGTDLISESKDTVVASHAEPRPHKKDSLPQSKPATKSGLSPNSDDDDDLEIATPVSKRTALFDRRKAEKIAADTAPLHTLRVLAQLDHKDDQTSRQRTHKQSVNAAQHLHDLRRRAKEQARAEREERVQELKARGVIIQSTEEIENQQAQQENLLEKARQNAEELRRTEKRTSGFGSDEDDEDDEDWTEAKRGPKGDGHIDDADDEEEEEADLVLSGSEEEEEIIPDKDVNLVLDEASEAADTDRETDVGNDAEAVAKFKVDEDLVDSRMLPEETSKLKPVTWRRSRNTRIVSSDEEETEGEQPRRMITPPKPQAAADASSGAKVKTPAAAFRQAFGANPFEANIDGAVPATGLTQLFMGSMAVDTTDMQIPATLPDFDVLEEYDGLPDQPQQVVPSSQAEESSGAAESGGLTDDMFEGAGPSRLDMQYIPPAPSTQYPSQFSDPTQDQGFQRSSPIPNRFVVALTPEDSPIKPAPLGRLKRKRDLEVEDVEQDDATSSVVQTENAFTRLQAAAKRPRSEEITIFDKKKSAARDMIEQQAEESEDEYAGLGGDDADPSDSEDSGNEEDKAMLDNSRIDVDENELAALGAELERKEDDKMINKLYKDITSGNLKRRRGAGGGLGELDDGSSDEDEAEERRRRKKQAEFRRMRKLLCQDENVGRLEGKKKAEAFLKTLEDRDGANGDDDIDFLSDVDMEEEADESQSQALTAAGETDPARPLTGEPAQIEPVSEELTIRFPPPRLPTSKSVPERSHSNSCSGGSKPRRATTMQEIKRTVSQLLDDPHSQSLSHHHHHHHHHSGSEHDDDGASDSELDSDPASDSDTLSLDSHPRRSHSLLLTSEHDPANEPPQAQFINRALLKRSESQPGCSTGSSSSTNTNTSRLAFAALPPDTTARSQPSHLPQSMAVLRRQASERLTALRARTAGAPALKSQTSSLSVDGDRGWALPAMRPGVGTGVGRNGGEGAGGTGIAGTERMAGGVEVGSGLKRAGSGSVRKGKGVGEGGIGAGGKGGVNWVGDLREEERRKREELRSAQDLKRLRRECGGGLGGLGIGKGGAVWR